MMLRMEYVQREENRRRVVFKKSRKYSLKDRRRMAEVDAFTWDLEEEEAKNKKRKGVKMGVDGVIHEDEELETSMAAGGEEGAAEEERKVKQQEIGKEWGDGVAEKRSKNSA